MKRGRPVAKEVTTEFNHKKPIGYSLQYYRVAARKSLAQVAKTLGVTVAYVSNVEHGRTSLAWKHVPRLAKLLRMPVAGLANLNLRSTSVYAEFERLVKTHG